MRCDLNKPMLTTNLVAEVISLREEIRDLRAVVDPLETLLNSQSLTITRAHGDSGWLVQSFAPGIPSRSGKTLAEALSALLSQLTQPEPKWTLSLVGNCMLKDVESENAAIISAKTFNGPVTIRRDGKPVCVFIDGERFNKAEGE